ncbi:10613_t:CDS:2 [Cetraspora pellucida]|uniref:10613_t:CDS:1 n=1 Tax=Cetraspora pellucida TaxID=1433469 RepID=A0A9N9IAF3_9GLOM|nr:10613_t:CDS:2 [Cetraspora pellucida]
MDAKDLPPIRTFNFIFEYGNESWTPHFVYPNHWRGGSTTNVSRQLGYDWQSPHIISTSVYASIAIYLTIIYTLSLMWEPSRRTCEINTSTHLY